MRKFYHDGQAGHDPVSEMHNGSMVPYREHSGRIASVLEAIGETDQPADLGLAPIAAVHTDEYLDFLRSAHDLWLAAGRRGDALAYAWPVVRRRPLSLQRIDALLGRFSFDATTPISATTWPAAYASAQTALATGGAVLAGARAAFGLCRPPGHHAGADYLGGYCYLNVAAVTAQLLLTSGCGRIAILDIDYHHGNGTQDIFWERGDVFYASLHADPATDYPFFWGHADEIGQGAGRGATLNLPLPRGTALTEYRPALAAALGAIARFSPDCLVVSFGADTFTGDPICGFELATGDYARIGADIGRCGIPTAILLEGGYAVAELGDNVTAFPSGFA
ncbi:histone deacetylase family protein [Novosphingobium sp. Gsoil 351]|uniref:histone deacetylase family protein n=1 Tax=Novosphingobium sp. Gsoil 351 TaxID=2675225 RepID=UPI0012B4F040|nr:histone deacetylase family protein [Novosphingobium sp. Gsoil 351]QGN54508.1 histone deacetylase family protein [Novosphingobium sp. Gsoil 351]